MSQNENVLAMLKKGPITPLEAFAELNIMRLGARIYDLRQSGHRINSDLVRNHDGSKRFAKYTLIEES